MNRAVIRRGLYLTLVFVCIASAWLSVLIFSSPLRPPALSHNFVVGHLLQFLAALAAAFFIFSVASALIITMPRARSGRAFGATATLAALLTFCFFIFSFVVAIILFKQIDRIWFNLYSNNLIRLCQTPDDTSCHYIRDLQRNSGLALCHKSPGATFYCEAKNWVLGACDASIYYRPTGSTAAANADAYKAQLSALYDIESDEYIFARKDKSAMFYEKCVRARGPLM